MHLNTLRLYLDGFLDILSLLWHEVGLSYLKLFKTKPDGFLSAFFRLRIWRDRGSLKREAI